MRKTANQITLDLKNALEIADMEVEMPDEDAACRYAFKYGVLKAVIYHAIDDLGGDNASQDDSDS